MRMKLKLPPPPDRGVDQLENHYEVEKAIASRLKQADRTQRARIYLSMYDELFEKVPDHPRLTRREDPERIAAANAARLRLLDRFLDASTVMAEFGAGDCRFAYQLCGSVKFVYGIDISDQRGGHDDEPRNFKLIVFDGYDLALERNSVNLVFSDQLIEHLPPDDATLHFQTARDVLEEDGVYVFRTPHRFTGPHDISKYFCDRPEGFHLKEWTYTELVPILRRAGYRSWRGFWCLRSRPFRVPVWGLIVIEALLGKSPRAVRRGLARYLLRDIFVAARK